MKTNKETTETAGAAKPVEFALNDKHNLNALRAEIDRHLESVARHFGLTKLATGNIRYDADGRAATVQVKAEIEIGGKNKQAGDFEKYATLFGLQADDLGKEFKAQGRAFQIVGLDMKRRTKPVVAEDLNNGKIYIFKVDAINRLLGRAPKVQFDFNGGLS
jgi:hypothetical protein